MFQRLEKHFKNNLQPQKIEITCPSTNEKINIVVHDFENSLKSLLSDQDLMQPENVLIDTQKPYERIDIKNDFFADIDTGSLWNDGWATCKKENKDVLCPLIFFIDKTHTDVQGKLSLEPVCFTLGVFNRKTRNQGHAWRTIGYLPNFDLMQKYKKMLR